MKAMYNGKLLFGPRGPAGPDGNPIGTIISYMGLTAPKDYLICDGAVYDIADYSKLAEFFEEQFGSINYFGGDGETTFAVPDMRNLFLRGYHGDAEEQLSGDVGVKQEGTQAPSAMGSSSMEAGNPYITLNYKTTDNGGVADNLLKNIDSAIGTADGTAFFRKTSVVDEPRFKSFGLSYTSRPVNMAVLYCIKATAADPFENVFSTKETRIGTWIDGKPLYRKVFEGISSSSTDFVFSEEFIIRRIDGMIYSNNGTPVPVNSYSDPEYRSLALVDNREEPPVVSVKTTGNGWLNSPMVVIVEYTKTTDQATIELPAMLSAKPMDATVAASASAASIEFKIGNEEV